MLFNLVKNEKYNYLTRDGEVYYVDNFLSEEQAYKTFEVLDREIPWQHDVNIMFGKRIVTKRQVAWYGDKPYTYQYAGSKKVALPWTESLKQLKEDIEQYSGETYNSCLLNLYKHGEEGMGWHSDNEKELKKEGTIASVSLGASRRFDFRHRNTKEKISIQLNTGSLLLMKGSTQSYWQHQLPKTKKVSRPRINLTFRTIAE
jgi:alkylated DNA repair dioxygenase AlkB